MDIKFTPCVQGVIVFEPEIKNLELVSSTHLRRALSVPANISLFKVNNRNTRKRCEICSKLTIKTPERRY